MKMLTLWVLIILSAVVNNSQGNPIFFKMGMQQKPKQIVHIVHVPYGTGFHNDQEILDNVLPHEKSNPFDLSKLFGGGGNDKEVIHHVHTYDQHEFGHTDHGIGGYASPWNRLSPFSSGEIQPPAFYPDFKPSYELPEYSLGESYHYPPIMTTTEPKQMNVDILGNLKNVAKGLMNMIIVGIKSASQYASNPQPTHQSFHASY